MRILLSTAAAASLRPELERIFAGRPFEVLTPPDGLAQEFDAAFVSRDVTGRSTKLVLEPHTQAFHDALRQSKALRWVHIHSAGLDRPIYPELQARGVEITNSSGANASIVAQTALAAIISLGRRLPLLGDQQRRREWKSLIGDPPRDLAGQCAVVVGWGPIGRTLGGWLQAIGLRVEVVRNSGAAAGNLTTYAYEDIREAASRADWLVLACPLSERTRGLVSAPVFAAMPRGSHIVNVARGEVVVEADLLQALTSGPLAGAYLDVFAQEPLPADSPLWTLPNVIITPHCAGQSAGNEGRVAGMFLANLEQRVGTG